MNNPYATPHSAVDDVVPSGLYQPRFFALSGRLGRVRYMAYLSLSWLVTAMVIAIVAGVVVATSAKEANPSAWRLALFVLYLPMSALAFILATRRLNDANRSGWWSVLLMVPILNIFVWLYLMFAAGSDGDNDYGPPTVPNTTGLAIVGVIMPVLLMVATIGVLAAVAIPAYSQYVAKAKAANTHLPAPSGQR